MIIVKIIIFMIAFTVVIGSFAEFLLGSMDSTRCLIQCAIGIAVERIVLMTIED